MILDVPRRPKRPSVVVGRVTCRPLRGPRDGRWYWRARWTTDGKREEHVLGWLNENEAETACLELVRKGLDRRTVYDAKTVRELLEWWGGHQEARQDLARRSVQRYRHAGARLSRSIGDVLLEQLDRLTLERHRDQCGHSSQTVTCDLQVLRSAWNWGRELGVCPARVLPSLKVLVTPTRNRRTPTPGDVAAVLPHLEGWRRIAVRLLWATGARRGEVAELRWDQVDLEEGALEVDGKTGVRWVPLPADLVAELRAWRPVAGPIWGDEEAGSPEHVLGVKPRTGETIGVHIHRAIEEANKAGARVQPFTPHGLRRAAVDALYGSGVDPLVAAQLVGHSPAVALKHYRSTPRPEALRDAARAVGKLPRGRVVAMRGGHEE